MTISVKWLRNHGVVVTRRHGVKKAARRFVRPHETLSVNEAAAALSTNDMRIYRLHSRGILDATKAGGELRIPLHEVKRLKKDPALLFPGRKAMR
jgi:excisionase family DNA binding protein